MTQPQHKPTKFYIDFENVHGAGLKGVDALDAADEVKVFYSQAAETFHIEQAIDILRSKASIEFVEVDAGTRNAADFQLIVALFGDMSHDFDYAIVSGDGGFDAAIKMGERMGLPAVRRLANVQGDEAVENEKPKSRRSRRSRSKEQPAEAKPAASDAAEEKPASKASDEKAPEQEHAPEAAAGQPDAQAEAASADTAQEPEQKNGSSRRRPRRRRRSQAASDEATSAAQSEEAAVPASDQAAPQDAQPEPEPEPKRLAEEHSASAADAPSATAEQRMRDILAAKDVVLADAQMATILAALQVANNRQDFYRAIIQREKQKPGLELYRQVRDSYAALSEALKA